jgi:3-phenylpropionate/trans-cinnamate dioxygenase ferredoxin reductase subunit
MRRVVIVGGGVAAHRCALALRAHGFAGSVVLASAEQDGPYDRTFLSKQCLESDGAVDGLALARPGEYAQLDIALQLGSRAATVDVAGASVVLDNGDLLPYDRLVICTGGSAWVPAALRCAGIHAIRLLEDARRLRRALSGCERLVVVGGGFIGAETAAAAVRLGIGVTLVEAGSAPMGSVLGDVVGTRMADLHRAHGVRVLTSTAVERIESRAPGHVVHLAGGEALDADAVVVGVGMRPSVDWLAGTPLHHPDGVVTDALCRTAVPGIFAAGDCALSWSPRYGRHMRVEHWDTAARHGEAAAASALGEGTPFAPVPFFWSEQHGVRLQWVGEAAGHDAVQIQEHGDALRSFVARYTRRGRLVAAFSAGLPRAVALARKELLRETAVISSSTRPPTRTAAKA